MRQSTVALIADSPLLNKSTTKTSKNTPEFCICSIYISFVRQACLTLLYPHSRLIINFSKIKQLFLKNRSYYLLSTYSGSRKHGIHHTELMLKRMVVKITDGMNHLYPSIPHNQHSSKSLGKQAALHLFFLDSGYL